jgi:hypothetical protein
MSEQAMSTPNPNPGQNPDTTVLHLNKLARGAASSEPAASESVTTFIAKAAVETVQQSDKPVVIPKNSGAVPPDSMLGVVSYCYAKGVYGSAEIERKMHQDTAFRTSFGNELPRPEDIRRFRRLNREAIQATLEKAFRFTRKKIVETLSPSNPFRLPSGAARSEETQAFAKREASERIDKASFIDGMSM